MASTRGGGSWEVRLVGLGGLGEFGANSLLLEENGDRLLIDAGVAFSDLEPFGVAYEVPEYASLGDRPLAVVCTHGHDDHVKGMTHLLEAFPDLTVIASRATLLRLRSALGGVRGIELRPGSPLTMGRLLIEGLAVSHSIPGALMVRVSGRSGRLVVATDFRMGRSALGAETSREALRSWGDDGVGLLLLDATNALVSSPPAVEEVVERTTRDLVARAAGAVVGVTFASHAGRLQQLARAAVAAGRTVVPVGRGILETLELAALEGGLRIVPGAVRPARDLAQLPRERLLILASGSQGEPGSAFSRMAADQLPGFALRRGDLVIHAARVIPGNERRLLHLFDECVRRGASVITAAEAAVHASGHAHRGELEEALALLRPGWVLPVHGSRRQLETLAELARAGGFDTRVAENGWVLEWDGEELRDSGDRLDISRRLLGDHGAVLDPAMVRERRRAARGGALIAVQACRRGLAGGPVGPPSLTAIGAAPDPTLLERLVTGLEAELRRGGGQLSGDPDWVQSTMARWLRTELKRARVGLLPYVVVVEL
jgi:ribonuclease J